MLDADVVWGPALRRPWDEWVDGTLLWLIALVATTEALLLLLAFSFPPDSRAFDLEQLSHTDRFVRLFLQPGAVVAPPRPDRRGDASPAHRAHAGPGVALSRAAPRTRPGAPASVAKQLAAARRARDRRIALRTGVLRVLDSSGGAAGLRDVLADSGLGADIDRELGRLQGRAPGAAAGTGLGPYSTLDGRGPGGPGGPGGGLVGLGPLDTGGDLAGGARTGPLGPPTERRILVEPGPATVLDALSREQVRQGVHARRRQVKACYDRALLRTRGLTGKVLVRFSIGPDGRVIRAHVVASTVRDRALEECLLTRIRRWNFPKPRGGGQVTVRYPFLFTPVGQGA